MKEPPPSRRKDRPCKACGVGIRRDCKSGYCAACVKTSPEFRKAASGAAHRRYSSPAERAKTGEGVRRAAMLDPTIAVRKSEAMKAKAADPAWKERNAQQCRARRLWEKGLAARDCVSLVLQGRTFSQRHGLAAWCPPHYLDLARRLRRAGIPLDDVKAMIAEQEAADVARYRRGRRP